MTIGIIGLGLIGGSFARDLRSQINVKIIGFDVSDANGQTALTLGLVDEVTSQAELIERSKVIILATPVNIVEKLLVKVLDTISDRTVVIDVGSTKSAICDVVAKHPARGRFVAAHPLAGTEHSGPEAALRGLFVDRKNIICEQDRSDEDALKTALQVFESIGLTSYYLTPQEHDKHLAYVSHLSHVSSFMLGLTVLDIEKDEDQIFNLASTGFASTVRLAKSNPRTWSAIFGKNKTYVQEALDQYIDKLQQFSTALKEEDQESLLSLMSEANKIKRVLN